MLKTSPLIGEKEKTFEGGSAELWREDREKNFTSTTNPKFIK